MLSSDEKRLSRRAALRQIAGCFGGLGASALLAACGSSPQPQGIDLQDAPAAPTDAPAPTVALPAPTAALAATAAPAMASTPTASADPANTITIWYYDDRLKVIAQGFEQANPGAKVDIKSYWPDAPYLPTLRSALSDGKGAPDLALVGPSELAGLAALGGLADMAAAPFDGGKLEKDMAASLWAQGLFSGKSLGMPWNVEPVSLWYRADVLESAGLASEPELFAAKAQTWEELFVLGQALKAKNERLTLLPDANDIFWAVVGQQGFGWFDGNRALIRQKGVKAAQTAAQARKLKLDANTDTNDYSVLLKQGLAVGWLGTPSFQNFIASYAPDTVGTWRSVAVPGGPLTYNGGLLVLPEQSKQQQLAWKFVQHLCATAASQNLAFTTLGAFPAYKPAWSDPLYDKPVAFFGGQIVYRAWAEVVEQAPAGTLDPNDEQASKIVINELKQVLYYDADPEQAMASAEAEVLRAIPGTITG